MAESGQQKLLFGPSNHSTSLANFCDLIDLDDIFDGISFLLRTCNLIVSLKNFALHFFLDQFFPDDIDFSNFFGDVPNLDENFTESSVFAISSYTCKQENDKTSQTSSNSQNNNSKYKDNSIIIVPPPTKTPILQRPNNIVTPVNAKGGEKPASTHSISFKSLNGVDNNPENCKLDDLEAKNPSNSKKKRNFVSLKPAVDKTKYERR